MESPEILDATESMHCFSRYISKRYGIKLTWGEQAKLRRYITHFTKKESESEYHGTFEALTNFMIDCFGLDDRVVDAEECTIYYAGNRHETKRVGLGLVGDKKVGEQFKQYCQNHVQQWREERSIPTRR